MLVAHTLHPRSALLPFQSRNQRLANMFPSRLLVPDLYLCHLGVLGFQERKHVCGYGCVLRLWHMLHGMLVALLRTSMHLCICDLILGFECIQAGDWLVSKDPRMKPKLAALQAMFPLISMTVLQERLAAAEGHLPNAVKVIFSSMETPGI